MILDQVFNMIKKTRILERKNFVEEKSRENILWKRDLFLELKFQKSFLRSDLRDSWGDQNETLED